MLDLLATGYPSLDHILPVSRCPAAGETALVSSVIDDADATFGGCGVNVAVGVRRLGLRAGVALVLGGDEAGVRYRDYLLAEGVDTQNVISMARSQTSRSYLFRSPDGEYQNFFFPGAADDWDDTLTLVGLEQVRWGLVTVGAARFNQQFAALLAERRIPIAWQLKPDIAAYPPNVVRALARASRIVFMNRLESRYLASALELTDARSVFDFGVEIIVLTRGRDGATILTPGEEVQIAAVARETVDTTGAGDAFTAGFLAAYLRGLDLPTCGQIGAVTASFALEKIGCQTNLPTWSEMQTRYESVFST